ncbi:hypothetical protein BN1326_150248 [Staphylococcus argenteus]|uniref:Uncharacterized protein n=1 Tax=Staphylococcus argenteus TaxID=985002 RepID=A0A7U7JRS7_9STAP|nr:hypothetical protein BN1326_150248 [Staphylococcus argenteus]CRI18824.1 hypothetical protein BN1326_150248 [Staphylococcus argenteus]
MGNMHFIFENKKRPHPYKGRGLRVATLFNNFRYSYTLKSKLHFTKITVITDCSFN